MFYAFFLPCKFHFFPFLIFEGDWQKICPHTKEIPASLQRECSEFASSIREVSSNKGSFVCNSVANLCHLLGRVDLRQSLLP